MTDRPDVGQGDAPVVARCVTGRKPRRWQDDKRAKGFRRGGPRKGLAYEVERVRVRMQLAAGGEQRFPLWAVAVRFGLHPRNLYFRLRRHHVPYVIGPKDGSPGRQVWISESSLPLIGAMVWKLPRM